MAIYDNYETVIGLEIHVQLSTHSKAFCGDDARFGGAPNTQISTISLGHPGTLPRLNRQQVEFAVRLGLALDATLNRHNSFDRKNYFYADLPKGYQITQDRQPICIGGTLHYRVGEAQKQLRIHHIHMEEDAGKSIHDLDPSHSLIDLNRAGVPLLEIVTEPDLRSAEEVEACMATMRQLVRYLDISDGNMEEGSLRCDCNISVRKKGDPQLGERCEVKNLNSMRFARRAIEFEHKRQIDLLEAGGKVAQETLNFDPATGTTSPLRDKEDAHDYRYFPEPDLPPVVLREEDIEAIRQQMPPLPEALRQRLQQAFQLPAYDAQLLTVEKATALYYLRLAKATPHYKAAANLLINKILPWTQEEKRELAQFPVAEGSLAAFIQLIEEGKLSNTIAYQRLFPALLAQPDKAPLELAQQLNLLQTNDKALLEQLVEEAISNHPQKVAAYRKGKKGLMGFFMGEVMRSSKGKAHPQTTQQLLRERLDQ
ncbi:MAG: Asp-tRNA(Asn)/Glu-tRNA(Gln) amidotransferase subunit GatB [Bacteroidota bacterium]